MCSMHSQTTQPEEEQTQQAALNGGLNKGFAEAVLDVLCAHGLLGRTQAEGRAAVPTVQWIFHPTPVAPVAPPPRQDPPLSVLGAPGCAHASNRLVSTLLDVSSAALRRHAPQLAPQLVDQVAAEMAQEVCGRLGPGDVYVPGPSGELRARRDDAIRAAFERPGTDGVPERSPARAAQLARQHGLTPRRVRSILAGK